MRLDCTWMALKEEAEDKTGKLKKGKKTTTTTRHDRGKGAGQLRSDILSNKLKINKKQNFDP